MNKEKCPICSKMYIPANPKQSSCNNEYCKVIASAKKAREYLYKKRIKQLGIFDSDFDLIGD